MKGPSLSCNVTFVQLLLQRSSDHESPQAANKRWCDSVKSKWIYGHPIWMNDSFLLWKLGWANMFDGHWNQQNVPLRGKKHITGDPTQHIIIPKPFFEGPASLPSYCSLATCSWHFGLLIIEFMFQGGWYVISNDPFFSQFCSLRGFFPLNSWHQKIPSLFTNSFLLDPPRHCSSERILAKWNLKKRRDRGPPANRRSSISITQGDTMLFGHSQKAVDVLKAHTTPWN